MTAKKPKRTLRGAPCYSAEEFLDYIYELLGQAKRAEVDSHLAKCRRCRFEIVRLRRAVADTHSVAPETEAALKAAKERVKSKLMERIARAAPIRQPFGESRIALQQPGTTALDLSLAAATNASLFLSEHYPEEVPAFEVFWDSTKKYLSNVDPRRLGVDDSAWFAAVMGFTRQMGGPSLGCQVFLSLLLILTTKVGQPAVKHARALEEDIMVLIRKTVEDPDVRRKIAQFVVGGKLLDSAEENRP